VDIGDETLSRLESEFRRGALALAVLSGLREPQYGYSLRQTLSAAGLPVEEGTLYPLLRRLEAQGLVASAWHTEGPSPRRYYRLSEAGRRALAALTDTWWRQVKVMEALLD
jgi:DNA-binding PadR family transcriptional regulator